MSAREVVLYHIEREYGTAHLTAGAPTAAEHGYLRLPQDGAFEAEMNPGLLPIPYGGGWNVEHDTVGGPVATTFRMRTYLYPAQAGLLLPWCATVINAGRTTPWVTTAVTPPSGRIGNLASMSLYRAVLQEDGSTFTRERLAGCMVQEFGLAFSRDGNGWIGALDISGMGKRIVPNPYDASVAPDATEFPLAADSDYPVGPYVLSHAADNTGVVKIGSDRAASLIGLRLRVRNVLPELRNASRFPSGFLFLGRQVTLEADIRLAASPDDRAAWREITAQDTEVILDDGTTVITLDLHGQARIDNWVRQTPMADEYSATLTVVNRHDNTADTDFSITVA